MVRCTKYMLPFGCLLHISSKSMDFSPLPERAFFMHLQHMIAISAPATGLSASIDNPC